MLKGVNSLFYKIYDSNINLVKNYLKSKIITIMIETTLFLNSYNI
jgi:hypothetical protein